MVITDLTNTTWVFNDEPNIESDLFVSKSYQLSFISKNITFTNLLYDDNGATNGYLTYGENPRIHAYAYNFDSGYSVGWTDEAYKTITITGGTDATNSTLISWLEANATQQAVSTKVTVDLTTLSGWGNVADGQHSIQVVAKADGYESSEYSQAVKISKGNKLYSKNGKLISYKGKMIK